MNKASSLSMSLAIFSNSSSFKIAFCYSSKILAARISSALVSLSLRWISDYSELDLEAYSAGLKKGISSTGCFSCF